MKSFRSVINGIAGSYTIRVGGSDNRAFTVTNKMLFINNRVCCATFISLAKHLSYANVQYGRSPVTAMLIKSPLTSRALRLNQSPNYHQLKAATRENEEFQSCKWNGLTFLSAAEIESHQVLITWLSCEQNVWFST